MITHSDEGPEREPDDPLAVLLGPGADYLAPPPGRYEAIRRGAARRRLARTVAGVGLTCAVAVLIALPVRSAIPDRPTSPTVPLAPPPVSSPSATPTRPTPSVSPVPVESRPAPAHGSDTARPTPSY